jgi:hypothetical protein
MTRHLRIALAVMAVVGLLLIALGTINEVPPYAMG